MKIAAIAGLAGCMVLSAAFAEGEAKVSRVEKLGGLVVRPGSEKGSVAFIDAQKAVALEKELEALLKFIMPTAKVNFRFEKAEPADPAALKAKCKSEFALIAVEDGKSPSLSVFPDDGYAVVNVSRYTSGIRMPEERTRYEKRCAKAVLKAYVLLCGGGGSQYEGHVAATHGPEELDAAREKLPLDLLEAMRKYMEKAGVTARRSTIYRKAVEEGWAPAPTNDYQKAIWDEVHALPTKPIKIRP